MTGRLFKSAVFCLLIPLFLGQIAYAKEDVIPSAQSAVSPEFSNGLHQRYLSYIAQKLGIEINVSAIPFARRLRALDNGTIDIMVGLSSLRNNELSNVYFIKPSYESISSSLFIKPEKLDLINKKKLNIAITRNSMVLNYSDLDKNKINVVYLDSLKQKIKLLNIDRIDGFYHLTQASKKYINQLDLNDSLVIAKSYESTLYDIHVGINKDSFLWNYHQQLSDIIEDGIANGDFNRIRESYYKSQQQVPQQ